MSLCFNKRMFHQTPDFANMYDLEDKADVEITSVSSTLCIYNHLSFDVPAHAFYIHVV